jgi:hypothetical protein
MIIMVDFIEKWRMKLFGRGVQTFKIEEINEDGRVLILRDVGKTKRRANSLIETWDSKGDELVSPPITYITSDSLTQPAFISMNGQTIELYTKKPTYPNLENIIGKAATLDDIADAMDLGKSVKNIIIGAILSGPVWWILIQGLGAMAK